MAICCDYGYIGSYETSNAEAKYQFLAQRRYCLESLKITAMALVGVPKAFPVSLAASQNFSCFLMTGAEQSEWK